MRLASLALLLAAAPLVAGCATNGEPANPNLLAPAVIVDELPDGSMTVFVHSAFGERRYDRIEVLVDNVTEIERIEAFSVEQRVNRTPFFLEVRAEAGESRFHFRGAFQLPPGPDDGVQVAQLTPDDEWTDARVHDLPFRVILDRPESQEAD